jgi:hypothetical protein
MQYVQEMLGLKFDDGFDVVQRLSVEFGSRVQNDMDTSCFKIIERMRIDEAVQVTDEEEEDRDRQLKNIRLDPEMVFIMTDHSPEWNRFFETMRKEEVNG